MPLQRVLRETFLRRPISMNNSVNRMSSKARAAHLYRASFSHHALVYRVCADEGMRGLYLGSVWATLARSVSWYMLMTFKIAETKYSCNQQVVKPGK